MKLVAGAGETAKAHTLKAMLDLQVRKTHLYFLALFDRSNSGVPFSDRAWLRASSLISRAIFLNGIGVKGELPFCTQRFSLSQRHAQPHEDAMMVNMYSKKFLGVPRNE
jgi:hypothetical protein